MRKFKCEEWNVFDDDLEDGRIAIAIIKANPDNSRDVLKADGTIAHVKPNESINETCGPTLILKEDF